MRPHQPHNVVRIGTTALLLLFASPLMAQQPRATAGTHADSNAVEASPSTVLRSSYGVGPMYTLTYDHLSGGIEVRDEHGRLRQRWSQVDADTPLVVRIPPERGLEVVVENANSFLYSYTVSVDVVARRDVRSCSNIGSRFATTGFTPALTTIVTGVAAPTAVAGQLLTGIVAQSSQAAKGAGGELSSQTLEGNFARIRGSVREFLRSSAAFAQLTATLRDSLALVAELAEMDSVPIDSLLARMQRELTQVQAGLSQTGRTRLLFGERTDSALAMLEALSDAVGNGSCSNCANDPDAKATMDSVVLLSRQVGASLAAFRTSYHQLQLTLRRLEVARAAVRQTFIVAASSDARRIELRLQSTSDSDFKDVPRLRSGAIDVFTEPVAPLVCELAAGVAWLGPPPSYAVNGGVVVNTAGSSQQTAFLLGLRVAVPSVPVLGVMAGLGLGTEKRLIIFCGGSARLIPLVRIDGGVAWQSEERLPPGVGVGGAAPAGGLGTLSRTYRPRWFWGVSVSP